MHALLRPLLPADRAELFLNRVPLDTTGQFARFPGGFLIPDITDPTVTAGFSPLFPVLTALGHALAGPQGALVVASLFAQPDQSMVRGVAAGRRATRWAFAAGWFFGLACFAKVDLLVLLPVFLLAVVAARLLTRARLGDTPCLLTLLAAFGLLAAQRRGVGPQQAAQAGRPRAGRRPAPGGPPRRGRALAKRRTDSASGSCRRGGSWSSSHS